MKIARLVMFFAFLFSLGCSAGIEAEAPAEQAAPLVINVSAVNQTLSLPSPTQYFCHPTMFVGSTAHSNSWILPGGIAAKGAFFGGDKYSISAIPNGGSARHDVQCDSWSNFNGSGATIVSNYDFSWGWPGTNVAQYVSGSQLAYYQDSVCWLSVLSSLSHSSEGAFLDSYNNAWAYTFGAYGYSDLSAQTRCAWLGRPTTTRQWLGVTTASPYANSSYSPAQGVCLIMGVRGNLDEGGVQISGNPMRLSIWGAVTQAWAMCIPY